jgi:hypothetical protein
MADEKKGSSSRNYHVLVRTDIGGWERAATIDASSAEQAIRLTADEKGAGRYAATPVRYWTELIIRIENPPPPRPVIIVESVDDEPPQSLKADPEPDDDDAENDDDDDTGPVGDGLFDTPAETRVPDDPPTRAQRRKAAADA